VTGDDKKQGRGRKNEEQQRAQSYARQVQKLFASENTVITENLI